MRFRKGQRALFCLPWTLVFPLLLPGMIDHHWVSEPWRVPSSLVSIVTALALMANWTEALSCDAKANLVIFFHGIPSMY